MSHSMLHGSWKMRARGLPLKLSMKAFSTSLPGRMNRGAGVRIGPGVHRAADELAAVVDRDRRRRTPPSHERRQRGGDAIKRATGGRGWPSVQIGPTSHLARSDDHK